MTVRQNISKVRERIRSAAERASRAPEAITLLAVSKRQPDDRVREAYDAGLQDFGENTVQELVRKATLFSREGRYPRWHFIGHLQRNKINKLVEIPVHRIHSVDSQRLATSLENKAPEEGFDVLIEVNLGEEAQKGGVLPADLGDLIDRVESCGGLRLRGLMTIPPASEDPSTYFRQLSALQADYRSRGVMENATELSMGMSGDFEAAISMGSTIVRLGTAIFGERAH